MSPNNVSNFKKKKKVFPVLIIKYKLWMASSGKKQINRSFGPTHRFSAAVDLRK